MINSSKLKDLISNCSNVVITSHKNIDLDALGADLGLYYICKNFNKEAYIIIEDTNIENEINRSLNRIKELDNVVTHSYNDIKNNIDKNTLLIITDTNKKSRIQNIKLLAIKNKVLIDHHIKSDDLISDLLYEYTDVDESSSAEIVMDLVMDLNIYIPSEVSTIILSGIYVDTNGFILKTNENTHSCAALLYKLGADSVEASRLLKQDFDEYKRRQELISNTKFYNNIAITYIYDKVYNTSELAKACDVLLTFNNVESAYVICNISENIVGISARSLGSIDVSSVMEMFNGGGHKTLAGAQVINGNIDEIRDKIIDHLGGNNEGNIY